MFNLWDKHTPRVAKGEGKTCISPAGTWFQTRGKTVHTKDGSQAGEGEAVEQVQVEAGGNHRPRVTAHTGIDAPDSGCHHWSLWGFWGSKTTTALPGAEKCVGRCSEASCSSWTLAAQLPQPGSGCRPSWLLYVSCPQRGQTVPWLCGLWRRTGRAWAPQWGSHLGHSAAVLQWLVHSGRSVTLTNELSFWGSSLRLRL